MKRKVTRAFLIACFLILAGQTNANADPIILTHAGIGSGEIGGQVFSNREFEIIAQANTNNIESFSGGFFADHELVVIDIDGVGEFDFVTGTRTISSNEFANVGFSRTDSLSPLDYLVDGPIDAAFLDYDLTTDLGPITGGGFLRNWDNGAIVTSGGVLEFNDTFNFGFSFSAELTPVPEPSGLLFVCVAVLPLMNRVRRLPDNNGLNRGRACGRFETSNG